MSSVVLSFVDSFAKLCGDVKPGSSDYRFVLIANSAYVWLPESLSVSFVQLARCLFVKRGDLEYVRRLRETTFRPAGGSFFLKKMRALGCDDLDIDLFMENMERLFDFVKERK